MRTRSNRTEQQNFRMTEEEYRLLEIIATYNNLSVSEQIRALIRAEGDRQNIMGLVHLGTAIHSTLQNRQPAENLEG